MTSRSNIVVHIGHSLHIVIPYLSEQLTINNTPCDYESPDIYASRSENLLPTPRVHGPFVRLPSISVHAKN
jgi:hypothetical protein